MAKRDFEKWLGSFRQSIAGYSYYTDFDKVYSNVDAIRVELNILNSLIGSKSIEKDFDKLLKEYPQVLKCVPILLAVRANEISVVDGAKEYKYDFGRMNYGTEQYKVFMRETGLFELISEHIVSNLVDYVTGVETGLDSNGRKNRGGDLMEEIVESHIKQAGFIEGETYFKEMSVSGVSEKWGIDLSGISNDGKTEKRFDFVVKTPKMIYGVEVNFYKGGGSKLNETARSYKTLAEESKNIDGFSFVWFTDGGGWKSAKRNLEETFDVLDDLYNIKDLEEGIARKVFK